MAVSCPHNHRAQEGVSHREEVALSYLERDTVPKDHQQDKVTLAE